MTRTGNHLWNATRVRNFMNAMHLKKGGFYRDIAVLACEASITVDTLLKMDPITYGVKVWGKDSHCCHPEVKTVLGWQNYNEMYPYYFKEVNIIKMRERNRQFYNSDYMQKPQENQVPVEWQSPPNYCGSLESSYCGPPPPSIE